MDKRLIKFLGYAKHPMLRKLMHRLSATERQLCEDFIRDNAMLTRDQFAFKVNRWYLDKLNKPANLTDMWALVMQCNSEG